MWYFPSSEENPFDIDDKATALDEKEDGQKDGDEGEEGAEEMEEDQMEQPGEENGQEPKTEEQEEEEGGGEKAEGDEESADKDEQEEEKEERGQEAGKDEDLTIPNDTGQKPKVCMSKNCVSVHCVMNLCVTVGTSNVNRRRRKEQVRMRSSLSQLRGRSTTQTVRLERRTFRVTQQWSWQERLQREIKLKRYTA